MAEDNVFSTTPPEDKPLEGQTTTVTPDNNSAVTGTETQGGVTEPLKDITGQPVVTPPKPDEFIENFNKRYNTQYKVDDDIKNLFGLPNKVTEYEGRLKESESIKKVLEEREKEIQRLESLNDPLKFFSSPQTYVAEQLRIKYPDKDPVLLQEIATADVDKMGDFDVMVKAMKIFVPNLPDGGAGIKDVLYDRYGIDPESKPGEWDIKVRTKLALDAATERNRINDLKKGIELPKVVTKEDREKLQADSLATRMQALTPLKEKFNKFDKFTHDGFEYDVPETYKQTTSDIFEGAFVKGNMDMSEDNLAAALKLRDASFLYDNFSKIKEVIAKQAKTELQAEIDAKLHNTTLPNTATGTDQGDKGDELPGISSIKW
jgi:hypothetical protein